MSAETVSGWTPKTPIDTAHMMLDFYMGERVLYATLLKEEGGASDRTICQGDFLKSIEEYYYQVADASTAEAVLSAFATSQQPDIQCFSTELATQYVLISQTLTVTQVSRILRKLMYSSYIEVAGAADAAASLLMSEEAEYGPYDDLTRQCLRSVLGAEALELLCHYGPSQSVLEGFDAD